MADTPGFLILAVILVIVVSVLTESIVWAVAGFLVVIVWAVVLTTLSRRNRERDE